MKSPYDLVIIGAGPGGMTAGIYAMRAELNAVLIEQSFPGGQVASTDFVENYPGFPGGIAGRDLAQKMLEHVQSFNLPVLYQGVTGLRREGELWRVETGQDVFYSRCVVLATGASPASLNVPGEERLRGRGVSYCATCDGAFYRDRDVVVVGGGDSAVEESLYLSRIVRSLHLIHRRDALRAEKSAQRKAFETSNINFIWDSVLVAIEGNDEVERVLIKNVKSGQESVLAVTGVFIYVGLKPNTSFMGDFVKLDPFGFVPADENGSTGYPGLFAVGDVRVKEMRQIATAVGDGASAANMVVRYLQGLA